MAQHYEVWAAPLGKARPVLFGTYELSRWQWAMKLAAFLRDKGHEKVEVRTVED